MDSTSRIVRLQQVMSQFALTFPKDESLKLSSALNYPKWHGYVLMNLSTQGAGLDAYFNNGDTLVSQDDPNFLQVKSALENALQVVLMNTISSKILLKYQSDNVFGFNLLQLVKRDYSNVSPRQLFGMVSKAVDCSINRSVADDSSLLLFRDVCAHFNHSAEISQFMGLLYLRMFKSDQALARVLDSPSPNVSLSAVENTLRDLIPVSQGNAFVGKAKSKDGKKSLICRRCQQKGHISTDCTAPAPVPRINSGGRSGGHNSSSVSGVSWAAVALTAENVSSSCYFLDSGSTLHISNVREHFTDFVPESGTIGGISDTPIIIAGRGTLNFVHPSTGHQLVVTDAVYAPTSTHNLISVKRATRSGQFLFNQESVQFRTFESDEFFQVGTALDESLYSFDYQPVTHGQAFAATTGSRSSIASLHDVLGHPSPAVMSLLGHPHGPSTVACSSCSAGKSTRVFPKESSTPPSTAPLQLIHADVCGPFPVPGLVSEKYFLTIVDDFTKWTQVIPLNLKSECNALMKNFILSSENHFSSQGFKVVTVRTDNGGEFCNNVINEFYFEKGIQHQLTVPYNSSQNGVVERKHRTIQEKVRILLHSSGAPNKFWPEAVKTAEFLINRYPSPFLKNKSPFELWFGYAPDYSIFHPFGVRCRVLVPPEKRPTAFSPVTVDAIFVGYDPSHKAYRCYVPNLGDVVVSNNVFFMDSEFPYRTHVTDLETTPINSSDVMFGNTAAAGASLPLIFDNSDISIASSAAATVGDTSRFPDSTFVSSSSSSSPQSDLVVNDPTVTGVVSGSGSSAEIDGSGSLVGDGSGESGTGAPHAGRVSDLTAVDSLSMSRSTSAVTIEDPDYIPSESMSTVTSDTTVASTTFLDQLDDQLMLQNGGFPPMIPVLFNADFEPGDFYDGFSDDDFGLPGVETVLQPVSYFHSSGSSDDADIIACLSDASHPSTSLVRSISHVTDSEGPVPKRHQDTFIEASPNHLIRTISNVTTSDGNDPKRTHVAALALSAINTVHSAFVGSATVGFARSISEFGVYSQVSADAVVLVALYVDDLLILSNAETSIRQVKSILADNFRMKDLGSVSTFLGMQVAQSNGCVSVHLSHYLSGFLAEFNMTSCNSVTTPLASGVSLVPDGHVLSPSDVSSYRTMVGKLLFAANTVRPDLSFAASALSRFIREPHSNHLAAAKHVLRYIKGTLNVGLQFKKQDSFNLVGYCDSDWAGDKLDRKSITGYVFMLGGTAITWKSTKQQTVALSSTEAEYMALGDAVKELLWLSQLLTSIGLKLNSTPTIFEDNEGCKLLSTHPVHHQRTKHIDIKHHFVRSHIAEGDCQIVSISTHNMIADMFTKNLVKVKFDKFVELAGMARLYEV